MRQRGSTGAGKETTVEIRVRVKDSAREALEAMAVSPNKQGALLTELLLAAHAEYQRLEHDPNSPPGMGVAYVLRKALDAKTAKAEAQAGE